MAGNFPVLSLLPKDRNLEKYLIKRGCNKEGAHFSKCMLDERDAGTLERKKYILAGQESYFGDAKIAHWIRFDQLCDKIINLSFYI